MVSYLATLFLGKPPENSLPVLRTHSFASNWQLALLESAEERIFSTNECAVSKGRSWDHCLRSGHATDRVTTTGILKYGFLDFDACRIYLGRHSN